MPKAFTETERELIRARLIESGRECFGRYGLSKTTIEDLVEPARISKASFYLFFESKEALYVETVLAEVPAMIDRLLDVSFRRTKDAREALVSLMKAIVQEIETNPITNVLLGDPRDFEQVSASLDLAELLERSRGMFVPLLDEIRKAQHAGDVVEGDPYDLLYAMGMIKLYPLNRRRIPEPLFSQMLDRSAQVIADGLTCPARAERKAKARAKVAPRSKGGRS